MVSILFLAVFFSTYQSGVIVPPGAFVSPTHHHHPVIYWPPDKYFAEHSVNCFSGKSNFTYKYIFHFKSDTPVCATKQQLCLWQIKCFLFYFFTFFHWSYSQDLGQSFICFWLKDATKDTKIWDSRNFKSCLYKVKKNVLYYLPLK